MYQHFFQLREKPFSMLPDPAFLYLSRQHQRALSLLRYGILDQVGFTVITGDVGCGKTTLLRKLLAELDEGVTIGLVSNTQCENFEELLKWILLGFGLEYRGKDKVELYDDFAEFLVEQHTVGRRVALVVDEAQNLDFKSLEQLRMLSNVNSNKHQLLQIVLLGQPSLWQQLARPELEQFVQRVGADYFLKPLDQNESSHYIHHRVVTAGGSEELFHADAIAAIWRYTNGVPRLINLLCDTTLVYAYADQLRTVRLELVDEVMRDKLEGLSRLWAGLADPGGEIQSTASSAQSEDHSMPLPMYVNDKGKGS